MHWPKRLALSGLALACAGLLGCLERGRIIGKSTHSSEEPGGDSLNTREASVFTSSMQNPLIDEGTVGDHHLNTLTGKLFKKTSQAWHEVLALRGLDGAQGPPGLPGKNGQGVMFFEATLDRQSDVELLPAMVVLRPSRWTTVSEFVAANELWVLQVGTEFLCVYRAAAEISKKQKTRHVPLEKCMRFGLVRESDIVQQSPAYLAAQSLDVDDLSTGTRAEKVVFRNLETQSSDKNTEFRLGQTVLRYAFKDL